MTHGDTTQPSPQPTTGNLRGAARARLAAAAPMIALLAGAGGCEEYSTTVANKEAFEPLPIYAEWWVATEVCSGRSGSLSAISWFTATSISRDNLVARGRWSPPHEIIIVQDYVEDELTVRHEMLHDLIAGDPDHEDAAWGECRLNPL